MWEENWLLIENHLYPDLSFCKPNKCSSEELKRISVSFVSTDSISYGFQWADDDETKKQFNTFAKSAIDHNPIFRFVALN